MTTPASDGDTLIDVVVRLPRAAIEDIVLSATPSDDGPAARRLHEARALLAAGRRRAAYVTGVQFGDPSWEMILELYVAHREQRDLAVSQLCGLSGGSTTTALRHIDRLETLGYIERRVDRVDRRRINVVMLAPLVDAIEKWLDIQIAALRLGS